MSNEWTLGPLGHNGINDQPWHRSRPGDTLRFGGPDPGPPPSRPHNMTSDQVPAQRWTCEYCGRKQASISGSCWSCGAPRPKCATEARTTLDAAGNQRGTETELLIRDMDEQWRLIEHMSRSTDRAVLKMMLFAASLAMALMAGELFLR